MLWFALVRLQFGMDWIVWRLIHAELNLVRALRETLIQAAFSLSPHKYVAFKVLIPSALEWDCSHVSMFFNVCGKTAVCLCQHKYLPLHCRGVDIKPLKATYSYHWWYMKNIYLNTVTMQRILLFLFDLCPKLVKCHKQYNLDDIIYIVTGLDGFKIIWFDFSGPWIIH